MRPQFVTLGLFLAGACQPDWEELKVLSVTPLQLKAGVASELQLTVANLSANARVQYGSSASIALELKASLLDSEGKEVPLKFKSALSDHVVFGVPPINNTGRYRIQVQDPFNRKAQFGKWIEVQADPILQLDLENPLLVGKCGALTVKRMGDRRLDGVLVSTTSTLGLFSDPGCVTPLSGPQYFGEAKIASVYVLSQAPGDYPVLAQFAEEPMIQTSINIQSKLKLRFELPRGPAESASSCYPVRLTQFSADLLQANKFYPFVGNALDLRLEADFARFYADRACEQEISGVRIDGTSFGEFYYQLEREEDTPEFRATGVYHQPGRLSLQSPKMVIPKIISSGIPFPLQLQALSDTSTDTVSCESSMGEIEVISMKLEEGYLDLWVKYTTPSVLALSEISCSASDEYLPSKKTHLFGSCSAPAQFNLQNLDLHVDPGVAHRNETISFEVKGASLEDEKIWDFDSALSFKLDAIGDSNTQLFSGYNTTGVKQVSVLVRDKQGCSQWLQRKVIVVDGPIWSVTATTVLSDVVEQMERVEPDLRPEAMYFQAGDYTVNAPLDTGNVSQLRHWGSIAYWVGDGSHQSILDLQGAEWLNPVAGGSNHGVYGLTVLNGSIIVEEPMAFENNRLKDVHILLRTDGVRFGPQNKVYEDSNSLFLPAVGVAGSVVIEGNFFVENYVAIEVSEGTSLIRDNVFVDNRMGVRIDTGLPQRIAYNSFAETAQAIYLKTAPVEEHSVAFNVFSDSVAPISTYSPGAFTVRNFSNAFDSTAYALCPDCQSVNPIFTHDSNALYADAASYDFRLLKSAVLVDAGETLRDMEEDALELGSPYDRNGPFPGNYSGGASDIGAFESEFTAE